MVDIAQVHATMAAALTWLETARARATCGMQYRGQCGPALLGRQFNPSASLQWQKDTKISDIMRHRPHPMGVLSNQ
jgi:hypothetical protein